MAEQEAHHAAHTEAHSEAPRHNDPKKGISDQALVRILSVVVVVMAVIIVALLVTRPSGTSSEPQLASSVLNSTGASAPQSTIPAPVNLTKINASSFPEFITPAQASIFIGNSITYNALAATSQSQLSSTLPYLIPNSLNYGITGEHIIDYNSSLLASGQRRSLQELILSAPDAGSVYEDGISAYSRLFNGTALSLQGFTNVTVTPNAISGGFTYSASSFLFSDSLSSPNSTSNSITPSRGAGFAMLGFKNNTVVFLQLTIPNSSAAINTIQLASIISSDIK